MKTDKYTHVNICKKSLTDNNIYENFKTFPEFTYILEHTTERYGHIYIQLMIEKYKDYMVLLDWKKLKENDIIGNPSMVNFIELKDYVGLENCYYSPSTIYYIYRGIDIIHNLLRNSKNFNILEIGGGYGGQCKLLIDMCVMFNVKIEKYGIIDLEYATKLQEKYLSTFGYKNIEYFGYESTKEFNYFELYNAVISIYALSEFDVDVQNYYVNNIIDNNKNYYILCNLEITNNLFNYNSIIDALPITGTYHKLLFKNE